jgi:hypothetical protein
VLICVSDDPELRPITARYPELEVRVERPRLKEQSFSLNRLPGAVATVAARLDGFAMSPAQVGSNVKIDGVVMLCHQENGAPLRQAVPGRDVVSVHTHLEDGAARMGMYVGGEVIMAQALLTQMGAASVGVRRLSLHGVFGSGSAGYLRSDVTALEDRHDARWTETGRTRS